MDQPMDRDLGRCLRRALEAWCEAWAVAMAENSEDGDEVFIAMSNCKGRDVLRQAIEFVDRKRAPK